MDAYFGPAGCLAGALAGFEPRADQEALAAEVADALESRDHLVAEAGTGTGKSLAYLLPALLSGQRVVVATATKALQEQLLTKDVPAAAAALGRRVRVAVLKGRQNYLCRKSLQGVDQVGGLKRLAEFPEVVAEATERRGPHALPTYAIRVADDFHRFYHDHRVLESEEEAFRLALSKATASVIARALDLMGVEAPERM